MTNRLINSQSLYLRKHAENPIAWWDWCPEALERALLENKPIFLSIGYSSCHWCTVMEKEAFSNLQIADYLNQNFIPIKLDREERPDLDSIYMLALQIMIGTGGWPLNIFLTPQNLIPFYGGTYFPVEPRYNRPGFFQVLHSVLHFYHQEKEKLQALTAQMLNGLLEYTSIPRESDQFLTKELLFKGIEENAPVLEPNTLGNPSFPMIPYANLILRSTTKKLNSQDKLKYSATQRGKDLALGGIFDHIAGGFHRYTVDSTWSVPHFEKMLYDNGQIVEYLANLFSAGYEQPEFKRAIALTLTWLTREMTAPEGYFYASTDADSFIQKEANEPEEGAFYVWNYVELQQELTPLELEELESAFNITPNGNFEGTNVLQRTTEGEISSTLEQILNKLFKIRYGIAPEELTTFTPARNNQEAKTLSWLGRIPPVTDTKMIVAWNSLMISGLARASTVFSNPHWYQVAAKAAQFILDHQWHQGRLHRLNYDGKVMMEAQSEDYALLIKALLDLFESNRDPLWLEKAKTTQAEFDQFFYSKDLKGYYNKAIDQSLDLLLQERSYQDNATPSANGVAIANLVRLALLLEDLDYLNKAEETLKAFATVMEKTPQSCPGLFIALDWYLNGSVLRSKKEVLSEIIKEYFPNCAYLEDKELPENALGILCLGFSCNQPANSLTELLEQLKVVNTL